LCHRSMQARRVSKLICRTILFWRDCTKPTWKFLQFKLLFLKSSQMHHHPRYENFRQDEYCNVGNNRVAGSPGNHGLYKSGLLLLCSTNKRTSVHNTKFSLSSVRIMIMSQLSFCMYGTCVLTWRMYNMTICIYMKCVVYKQALTWRKSAFRKLKIALARYHA